MARGKNAIRRARRGQSAMESMIALALLALAAAGAWALYGGQIVQSVKSLFGKP